jgi:hypothetical protein
LQIIVAIRGRDILKARALEAPASPGVYLIRDTRGELLYVGKAIDLRRRLLDHARTAGGFASRTRSVTWLPAASEREALCIEADLIAGLSPPFNAVMAHEPSFFICVTEAKTPGPIRKLRFAMAEKPIPATDWVYGAFPHLGKGKISWRATRTNPGYAALLRLCWITFADPKIRHRIPGRLAGVSAPFDVDTVVEAGQLVVVRAFMNGSSNRLLVSLEAGVASAERYMQTPLNRDLEAASEFYELGPRALKQLRAQHNLRSGPLPPEVFSNLMRELAAIS